MRLWHKALIPYLPRQQLLGQWRECCCIAKNIVEKGTPNHILVNKIMRYQIDHFIKYSEMVCEEMDRRGYKTNYNSFDKWILFASGLPVKYEDLFKDWHNTRYLKQCIFNLEEKHDCQGITDDEWNVILKGYKDITGKRWEN